MTTKGKAALVAAIVALMGGGAWWYVRSRDAETTTVVGHAPPKPSPEAGGPPPSLAASGGMDAGAPSPAAVDAPPPVGPHRPESPSSATLAVQPHVRFRSGTVALSTEEARKLYAVAGVEPRVVLVAEEQITGGPPGRTYARTFSGETQSWQRSGIVEWQGEPRVSPAVEPGRWWAVVARPGLPPAFVRATVGAAGGVGFEVDLRPSGRATRVRFVDPESKEPVLGVRVVPYVEFGDDAAFVAGPALLADARGEVSLALAAEGEDPWRPVSWWALAEGRAAPVPPAWATAASKDAAVDVPLPRTATVTGRAFGPDGKPAAGATVAAGQGKGHVVHTTVHADGTYALAGVVCSNAVESRERVVLVAGGDAFAVETYFVAVKPGGTVIFDLGAPFDPAAKSGALRGRVTAGGRPLSGHLVGVGKERFAETRPDGTFRFEGLPPGPVALMIMLGDPRVSDDAMLRGESLRIPAEGGEVALDLDLPDGAIRVRVVDAATGAPVAGAWVAASPEGAREDKERFPGVNWKIGWSGVADDDGIAWMRGLTPAAPFTVRSMTPIPRRGTAQSAGIVAGTGAAPTEVTLRLAPGGK